LITVATNRLGKIGGRICGIGHKSVVDFFRGNPTMRKQLNKKGHKLARHGTADPPQPQTHENRINGQGGDKFVPLAGEMRMRVSWSKIRRRKKFPKINA